MDPSAPRLTRAARLTSAEAATPDLTGTAQKLDRLCRAAARDLPASGVAVCVVSRTGVSATAAASDPACARVEELQFTLGEGPCLEAVGRQRAVFVHDLERSGDRRWPGYTSAAVELGVRAVYALPLLVGTSCLGALDVYRAEAGPFSLHARYGALAFAAYATATLLEGQEQSGPDRSPSGLDDVLASRFEVHQAQGMLTVQLGVGLEEAMARLRAHAFVHGLSLAAVAREILAGSLVLERDPP